MGLKKTGRKTTSRLDVWVATFSESCIINAHRSIKAFKDKFQLSELFRIVQEKRKIKKKTLNKSRLFFKIVDFS